MTSTIDVWAQVPTERFTQQPWLDTLLRWTGQDRSSSRWTLDDLIADMDSAGVDRTLVCAWAGPTGMLIDNDEVAAVVRQYPGRLTGVAAVDIRHPVAAVAELRRSVEELGCVALRIVPWLWNLPPDDRRFYPLYAACVELNIPVCTQIGHTGPLCESEPGRPIPYLDRVLLEFPELTVVGGHVGYPWIDEVLSLAMKYPNFFIDTSAYVAHRLPGPLIEFMRGHGRDRVLFGTNWPMITPERCLSGLHKLDLDDKASDAFLVGNARRLFGL